MQRLILLLLVATASAGPTKSGYSKTPVGGNVDKASVKIFHEAYLLSGEQDNLVTSPLGVILLLAVYSSGTQGKTRNEITNFLGESDYIQMLDRYSDLSSDFATMDPNYLALANKIYIAQGRTPSDQFLKTARRFETEVENVDFHDTQKTANKINEWANLKYRNIIKDPVTAAHLDSNALILPLDLVYFKGRFNVLFEPSLTADKDFHVSTSSTVKKPMMHLRQSLLFRDSKELEAKLIELPYKETGFRMVVVLPNEVDGLSDVVEKVSQKGLLDDVLAMRAARSDIDLFLPKFEIKESLDFAEILPKLGVNGIFKVGATGVVKDDSVTVSKILQETSVRVNEEGSAAGSLQGESGVPSTANKATSIVNFVVDRPFMFAILHEDVIVFLGTYIN